VNHRNSSVSASRSARRKFASDIHVPCRLAKTGVVGCLRAECRRHACAGAIGAAAIEALLQPISLGEG
jgi:hypothetical protein